MRSLCEPAATFSLVEILSAILHHAALARYNGYVQAATSPLLHQEVPNQEGYTQIPGALLLVVCNWGQIRGSNR